MGSSALNPISPGCAWSRDDTVGDGERTKKEQNYFYLNNPLVGEYGDDPAQRSYAEELAYKQALEPTAIKPITSVDFDANFQYVGPDYPGLTPGSYTVRACCNTPTPTTAK